VFRQLIARGYLHVDADGFGVLKLTDLCRPLLRGEAQLEFRKQHKSEKTKSPSRRFALEAVDEPLFEALRTLRLDLAQQQGVPPYVIFHDKTLLEMARLQPQSLGALHAISGVGEQKLQRYGDAFLNKIVAHSASGQRHDRGTPEPL